MFTSKQVIFFAVVQKQVSSCGSEWPVNKGNLADVNLFRIHIGLWSWKTHIDASFESIWPISPS